jgi:hypothetical protein
MSVYNDFEPSPARVASTCRDMQSHNLPVCYFLDLIPSKRC